MATKLKAKSTKVVMVDLDDIEPSPENDDIYGEIDHNDNDQINLTIDVQANGVREALVVSADDFIISGHPSRCKTSCERQLRQRLTSRLSTLNWSTNAKMQ